MRSQKMSSWAEISDDEDWSHEEVKEERPEVADLKNKLQRLRAPYRMFLSNLSFSIETPYVLLQCLGLAEEDQVVASFLGNTNKALLKVFNVELANRIAEKYGTVIYQRPVVISLSNHQRRNTEDRNFNYKNKRFTSFSPQTNYYNQAGKLAIPNRKQSTDSKPKPNPFGDARPVDTLAKELEFEKKLKTKELHEFQQQPVTEEETKQEVQPKIKIPVRDPPKKYF